MLMPKVLFPILGEKTIKHFSNLDYVSIFVITCSPMTIDGSL
jgi:hypothetical protein